MFVSALNLNCTVLTLATEVTHCHCIKNIQFILTTGLQSALEPKYHSKCSKCSSSIHTVLKSLEQHAHCLQRASIKHCLRSTMSQTGIWYTRSCIMPHMQESFGLRAGLFKAISVEEWKSGFDASVAWLSNAHGMLTHCLAGRKFSGGNSAMQ